jgi:hypothetical protein
VSTFGDEECSREQHRRIQLVIDIEEIMLKSSRAVCNFMQAF